MYPVGINNKPSVCVMIAIVLKISGWVQVAVLLLSVLLSPYL